MKRIGIFLFYDEDGIVDDCVTFLLEHTLPELSKLLIVCNGKVSEDGSRRLSRYSEDIYIRENIGFDAGGFKDALTRYLNWDNLNQYDELLLFNDSFFGPFRPFSEIFSAMEHRELDFWSLTKNTGSISVIPSVQSYFLVIRSSLLHSKDFGEYWENLPYYRKFTDVVEKYEKNFAQYFVDRGYTWDSYVDVGRYDISENKSCFSPYHSVPYEIMKRQGYPIIKRKVFAFDAVSPHYGLDKQSRENLLLAINYIKYNTTYDIKLIWDHILRLYPLRDIQDSCCMRYILPYEPREETRREKKSIIFIWLQDQEVNLDNIERINRMSLFSDFIFFVDSRELEEKIHKILHKNSEIIRVTDIQERLLCLLSHYREWTKGYEYFAVLHDYDCAPTKEIPYTVEASHVWGEWENIIGNEAYIQNVENLFQNNRSLGLLVSPKPAHGPYIEQYAERLESSSFLLELSKELGIKKMENQEGKLPYWSSCFWCKCSWVDDSLLDKTIRLMQKYRNKIGLESCNEAFEKILPLYAQKRGYYSGIVQSECYAQVNETIMNTYLEELMWSCKKRYRFSDFGELLWMEKVYLSNETEIKSFIRKCRKIYIYGAGEMASRISGIQSLQPAAGFIVSDGQKKAKELNGKKIWYLSEIKLEEKDGIIVALNKEHTAQVLPVLKSLGWMDRILCLK